MSSYSPRQTDSRCPPPTAEEDAEDEARGVAYAAALPWGKDGWMQDILERLVRGDMSYGEFTVEWWAERTGEALLPRTEAVARLPS